MLEFSAHIEENHLYRVGGRTDGDYRSILGFLIPSGMIYLAATEAGLIQITLPNESFAQVEAWVSKKIPKAILIQDPTRVSEYKQQVQQYLDGTRKTFTFPLDFRGTAFQNAVWQALFNIPYGEMRSYAEIAEAVGNPKAVRAVGTANGMNPIPIVVPCHR
ncbi:methylated-DNA--[protein]-cysteine S-methyltransferase [Paenibacillus lupini]|uniref:methylated-DNA--[protein]-cysteine S-methyltransferase n=1 Tax=Paenibacillus lupini TaxID=1450204 RepID=UPI003132AE6C|nr:O6-methylguanine-DNA--protein-cysteine methyltransferase [Paenibacillus lupini]